MSIEPGSRLTVEVLAILRGTMYRQAGPPSPLVFSPETVLSPLASHPASSNVSSSNPQNTVSMPFVRRHVTRRLKAAKAECDRELQRVTNNITAFFEERLREGDDERELREFQAEHEHLKDNPYSFHPSDLRSALQTDESGSESGWGDSDVEPSTRHSRQASSTASLSPGSLRRQTTNPWERPLSASVSSTSNTVSSSPATSNIILPDAPLVRKQSNSASPAFQGNPRRLSRSIHISNRSRSGRSSRSTSRSRSPLPTLSTHEHSNSGQSTVNRRASRILVDDPIDPIMTALYDLIGVATDVTDMTVTQLTASPKVCEGLVGRVQSIGKAWDDHPDWHGRNWYVQVLLAVASLSRVVEWWEAEKQFWNFDDDSVNNGAEEPPLMFVTKSAEETIPAARQDSGSSELDAFKLNPEDENKLRLTRPPSQGRRSRDAHPKELSMSTIHSEDNSRAQSHVQDRAESARILATERLRLQAETAQNQNIVIELSLDGDHLIWVNYAWNVVVGTDAEDLYGSRLSSLLAPSDWNVFRDATRRLQEDDSHTVEVRFRLQVEPEDGAREPPPPNSGLYRQMEGKGMLMIDREDGEPSHTMWVVRPLAPPRWENESHLISLEQDDAAPEPASSFMASAEQDIDQGPTSPPSATFPFALPISTDPILCRICENQIPQWYFEKHSETCAESHRLEAEVAEFNESIDELRNTIRDLAASMDKDKNKDSAPPPEYRGMPIYSPSSSPVSIRNNKMQRLGVKRMQRRLLDQLEDILQVAAEVSTPSLKEEEAKEPIERQRLLSPGSERKITQIRTWAKPTMEDPALSQLIADAERVMRGKVDNVIRMQNTIRYSEKIWREWEEKVNELVAEDEGGSDSDHDDNAEALEENIATPPASTFVDDEGDDHSSTKSEYAFSATPLEPVVEPVHNPPTSPERIMATRAIDIPTGNGARAADIPIPAPYPTQRALHTRSSTPSSISSPLALAEPIVASHGSTPPPMRLDKTDSDQGPSTTTIRARSSHQSLLEPKFVVTPPASPQVIPKDKEAKDVHKTASAEDITDNPPKRSSSRRRHSINPLNPALSPTAPLSPRVSAAAPIARTTPTSIKDFDIIKPISKGAFGSVFLAKKKATGDYFAIKVLKKADMIAKNQITNVKAERMILMKQAESPFVAKLFFTFQSKDNLYLVMEYLNGGDCAALIKSLGSLPEEWTRNYIAEVILGLEYLHQRGIVHRDLKPDNLLIDQHGHLKLTDFGLSRIGLLGRQTRERDAQQGARTHVRGSSRSRPPSMDSAYLSSPFNFADISTAGGSYFHPRTATPATARYPHTSSIDDASDVSGGSDSVINLLSKKNPLPKTDSPLQSFASELTTDLRSHSHSASGGGGTPPGPGEQKFAGTPDYLAPEAILGLRGDDAAVDWWALGVITYEFLYGIPPFHAESPEKVFENILSGHIEWHEEWVEFSEEARDFMARLMTLDPAERLGANGADEVKAHPFLHDIEWDQVTTTEAAFIPQITDPESTDYFDPRGAIPQLFYDDDQVAVAGGSESPVESARHSPKLSLQPVTAREQSAASPSSDDFGSFSFKNLPVLKQANDDVIRKLKTDQMAPITHALSEPTSLHGRKRSISHRNKKPPSVVTTVDPKTTNPPSPATSTSSLASSPSRSSIPTTPGSATGHARKPSEYGTVERFKVNLKEGADRRGSISTPSRLRTASISSAGDTSGSENWNAPSTSHDLRKGPDPNDRAVTCLLAEDNPITAKIIETLLIRLGCRCVVVADGSEAISVAMGDIKFDIILMDLHMPVLDGEGAARYIKSTNSRNTATPIVAVSAESNVFSAYLAKPVQKADLLAVMRQLGFKTLSMPGPGPAATTVAAAAAPAPVVEQTIPIAL
ncbi:hypothetical protein DL96DRAFT_1593085 [Flagelloscypha sp. PMI_526]|nr:hypothetical protein DL96DRAFT_1593085 [Flagelloscypha sp. PMI_526]